MGRRAKKNREGRIRSWRESLGISQAGLSKDLGVSQGTVSGWEEGTKERAPSKEMYLRMGFLSEKPDDIRYFLKQANIEPQDLVRIIERLSNKAAGSIIEPLPGSVDAGGVFIQGPGSPRAASLRYLVLEESCSQFLLRKGDLVIIDTSLPAEGSLLGLWDKVVLAKLPPQYKPTAEGMQLGLGRHYVGILRLVSTSSLFLTWAAHLDPVDQDRLGTGVDIGYWRPADMVEASGDLVPALRKRFESDPSFREGMLRKIERRAESEIRAAKGVEVLGRVRAWIDTTEASE